LRILITNDDGIDAPGLAALEQAAAAFGEVLTVAPHQCYSSCGHGVTPHRGLQITEVAPSRYMLDGSPADCVRIGLLHLANLHLAGPIDWVLSGINHGGNLGADIYMSGTVAAAREATLLGKPAVAFSQYVKTPGFAAWPQATRMAVATLEEIFSSQREPGLLWNVNLPDAPGGEIPPRIRCPVDRNPLPFTYETVDGKLHYRSNYHGRARTPGSDVDTCFGGSISISRLGQGF
jgi:5'-nucleotidase